LLLFVEVSILALLIVVGLVFVVIGVFLLSGALIGFRLRFILDDLAHGVIFMVLVVISTFALLLLVGLRHWRVFLSNLVISLPRSKLDDFLTSNRGVSMGWLGRLCDHVLSRLSSVVFVLRGLNH
jgi:hypothetical protein